MTTKPLTLWLLGVLGRIGARAITVTIPVAIYCRINHDQRLAQLRHINSKLDARANHAEAQLRLLRAAVSTFDVVRYVEAYKPEVVSNLDHEVIVDAIFGAISQIIIEGSKLA